MSHFIEEFYYGNIEPQESITEQLKEVNKMEWVARMNNIEERARETVNHELVFTA